ncbi:hypothetical protein ACFO8O_07875 [Hephaestia sp. GCM10023244]|uniref:hypothetical protein n=1 Tax=unclassified Hephaestia TaxID=2631281 RepID=UPI00207759D7|nr:hypothetical protein [Hephaestia sp. MAHUQ-44]MCM8730886.1 hypothetical protein [Hephaestia sp. MAHUQ-44]
MLAIAAAMVVAACASHEEAARDTLARAVTCPIERVTATQIDGVRWSEVRKREHPIPDPPADILADPQRLALWQAKHAPYSEGFDWYYKAFHVAGCGHEAEYLCQCPIDAPAWRQYACHCETATVPLVAGTRRPGPDR